MGQETHTGYADSGTKTLTVESHVRLLGEGTDCSRPTKAINIGDGLFQLDAPNLYVAMTRLKVIGSMFEEHAAP